MAKSPTDASGALRFAEMREFASFLPAEGRYIKRSLDVAAGTPGVEALWGRTREEQASIANQRIAYAGVAELRRMIQKRIDNPLETLIPPIMKMTRFDLLQNCLTSFSAYRFLYERLLGSKIRPWLPSTFCGTAALPEVKPVDRRKLLQSISEAAATAAGWSEREPFFFPEWVDKDP